MKYIDFVVREKHIESRHNSMIADNTDYVFRFTFLGKWTEFETKTVLMLREDGKFYKCDIKDGATSFILPKFTSPLTLLIGATAGSGEDEISTDRLIFNVRSSIRTGANEELEKPESGAEDFLAEYCRRYDELLLKLEALDNVYILPSVTSDDAGKVLTVSEEGKWKAGHVSNTKVMTVTAAGAKGDGVTDDTAAFKTALANYRNVFVPGGTYKLTEGLTIRDACKLELAPDAVLCFTQTSGNCISMKMSAYLCGNHAVIEVPYGFSGNVIYVSTALNTSVTDVPPFTKWDPQWKTARYITDISISKQDSRGFHYSIDGGCSGTAVYIEADGGATSTFIWGLNFSGLRIAGAFSYGIHAKTIGSGYNHEMRLEALIDACEIGLCLEDCNNAYAAVTVQPRPALTTGEESIAYAKHGIQLIRSRNTDLSGARVWDWNADKTLWTSDAGCKYQHIAMVGNCSGTILNDFLYYEMPSYDIRSLIYTDTPTNLEKITILQEPFTRWFRPVDNKPMFYNGSANNELLLKSAFDAAFQTEMVANFDNKLLKSANADGTIFNDTGYQSGAGWSTDGVTLNTGAEYAEITCTGFIPCAENAVIRLKGMSFASGNDYCRVVLFDSSKAKLMHVNRANLISNASSYYINNYTETEDGCQFTIVSASAAYFKLNVFTSTLGASPAISVNEEMSYRQEGYLADGIKVKAAAVEGGGGTDTSLGLTGATVGQTVKIKAVDENGAPTEWEAVSGRDEWIQLCDIELTEATNAISQTWVDTPMRKIKVSLTTLAASANTNYMPTRVLTAPDAAYAFWCANFYPTALPITSNKSVEYIAEVYNVSGNVHLRFTEYYGGIYGNKSDLTTGYLRIENVKSAESTGNDGYGDGLYEQIIGFSVQTYGTFEVGTKLKIWGVAL